MRPISSKFMLFGMGSRRKFVYMPGGELIDALSFDLVKRWDIVSERMDPSEYCVTIMTRDSREVRIFEDEKAVWMEDNGECHPLSFGRVLNLPRFDGHPQAALLRALHGEILVNIMPFGPVPNLWVYPRPWYRDSAMMLMCLRQTGNLQLVEGWVAGLHKVWDRNNSGEAEADNLGQCLYMISLFEDRAHPLIDKIMKAVPQFRRDNFVVGRSDYAEHPVYQTKWMKYGLKSLDMDDPFRIPEVYDSYSSLFWMDYRTQHVDGAKFSEEAVKNYPYLGWAEAHFFKTPPPMPLELDCSPLTWEGAGSEAEYWRLSELYEHGFYSEEDARRKFCCPHTWHAAEMFLYLSDPRMI